MEEEAGEVFSWVGKEGREVVGRLRGAEDGLTLIFSRRGSGEEGAGWRGFHPPDCMTGLVNFG